jgi:hypothetical protein
VIDNCYAVLKKTPRYSFGQAPDWCTASGGQSADGGGKKYQGLGMLSDAIRTPYRIAADALWFGDARAMEYCKNSAKTLTEYGNTNIRLMAAQMGLYDNQGKLEAGTGGSFDNIAMWSCAILGSKDPTYSTKGLQSTLIAIISGAAGAYFGEQSLSDHLFYYKQSIAMLGFALIGGQFPNIQADKKDLPLELFTSPRYLAGSKTQHKPNLLFITGMPGFNYPDASKSAMDLQGRRLILAR